MPLAKQKNGKVKATAPYFVVTKQLPGNATLFGIPGDTGALIDALKLYNVSTAKQDQLQRLYIKRLLGPVIPVECRCGAKFDSEGSRQAHIERRHLRKSNIKDFNECSEAEREAILQAAGPPGLTPRDPEYYVGQQDFHVPDPDDRRAAIEDRQLQESIDWTQTAASKK